MLPNLSKMYNIEVTSKFEECISMILSGTKDEIHEGWLKLPEFESITELKYLLKDGTILRRILNGQVFVSNNLEISRVMNWFSKYITEDIILEKDPISNDVAVFLKNSSTKDITLLTSIIEVLLSHSPYLPMSANHTKLCESIVVCLASFQMSCQPESISEFNENMSKIQEFLSHLCSNEQCTEKVNLIIACFSVFYNIISDTTRQTDPGPALVVVLQLVDTALIQQAVKFILSESRGDEQLVQALKVLCIWSTKLLRGERLGIWIMAFILELEATKKYSILKEVTDVTLERLFIALLLPMGRQNLSSIVFHILRRQSTPNLFHKISKRIELMIQHISKDDSELGKECVQNIVDVAKALMIRFPGYPFYDYLHKILPVEPRMNVVHEIVNGFVWADDLKETEPFSFRSNSGKVGLTNLGNTCYMNSVLQALLMTRQFCNEVLSFKRDSPDLSMGQAVLRKLENLFGLLLYSKRISLAPTEILLASRPTYFMPGQQQDSSEFLCHLLDVLYEQEKTANIQCGGGEMNTEDKLKEDKEMSCKTEEIPDSEPVIKRWTTEEDLTEGVALQRKTQSLADFSQGEDLAQNQQLSDSHSDSTDSGIQSVGGEDGSMQAFLVHRVFGGESKITYQCAQCDTSSHNTDKFRDLQLCFPSEIPENQEVSVQDLLNYYLTPEKLTGENKYRCDKCMKLCDAQRIIKILQAPSHLILTLKHFHYDSESRLRTKLRHKVMYNETIQVPVSLQSCTTATETYNLYAAVVHSGYSMDYGHYFTYACDSKSDWYKFNDSYVFRSSLEDFKNLEPPDTPYILFYAKTLPADNVQQNDEIPELSTLNKRVQELIAMDAIAYKDELRQQSDRKKNQHSRQPMPLIGRHDNSDDENPPPSSCRSAVDIPTNRFLF